MMHQESDLGSLLLRLVTIGVMTYEGHLAYIAQLLQKFFKSNLTDGHVRAVERFEQGNIGAYLIMFLRS